MPIYDYTCKDGHLTEKILTRIPEIIEQSVKCATCGKIAKKELSRCAVHFQPYAFAQHGYSTHKDRMAYCESDKVNDFGGADREVKAAGKDIGSRQWTNYADGSGSRRIKTDKPKKEKK